MRVRNKIIMALAFTAILSVLSVVIAYYAGRILFGLGGLAIIFGVLTIYLHRSISCPLHNLVEKVTKITEIASIHHMPVATQDEIDILTTTFNTMTDILCKRLDYTKLLEEEKASLELVVNFDDLTGIYNRRYFNKKASDLVEYALKYNQDLFISLIDLDHFKKINDTYGHPVGDKVLQGAAALIKNSIREDNLLARYGGEEFILLITNASEDTAHEMLEHLRKAIEKTSFKINHWDIALTASFGVASILREHSLEATIERADIALYKAKNSGRNRVVYFEDVLSRVW